MKHVGTKNIYQGYKSNTCPLLDVTICTGYPVYEPQINALIFSMPTYINLAINMPNDKHIIIIILMMILLQSNL